MDHKPVLLDQALCGLDLSREEGVFIDATFGRGGHSQGILNQLKGEGRLIIIDQDPEAITFAKEKYGACSRVAIYHHSFAALKEIAEKEQVMGKVKGILFDLGVSSPQLDKAERGFSFMKDGPLDMRMNTSQGITAEEWIAITPEEDLVFAFREYGEEKFAKRIASAIVKKREVSKIKTTKQLSDLIVEVVPTLPFSKKKHQKHPATRTFQAIRIAVNQELSAISEALLQSLDVLDEGGRLVVISFHSLEDRIVKSFIRKYTKGLVLPKEIPLSTTIGKRLNQIGKAIKASDLELAENIRARSAVLRIAEKTV